MHRALNTVAAALIVAAAGAAAAGTFVPADDGEVLERLPYSPLAPAAGEVRNLREQLSARPDDPQLAAQTARRYLERGRALSDPRFYGYAQAVLAPWWEQAQPPTEIQMLRATILQHEHRFDAALADLESVVARDPAYSQAWLTLAVVQQVTGRYAEARESCVALLRLAPPLLGATCVASVASLQGAAERSYEVLRRTLERSPDAEPATRQWALTVLGEIAERRSDAAAAEGHYRSALALDPNDTYLLAVYGDFLLDRGRNAEVVALLGSRRHADALLLRLAIAEQRAGAPEAAAARRELEQRFAAAGRRGDAAHGREQGRFLLEVLGRPEQALQLAGENWAVQREPLDARLLLASALAAGRPAAAAPALEFVRRNQLQDVRLTPLLEGLTNDGNDSKDSNDGNDGNDGNAASKPQEAARPGAPPSSASTSLQSLQSLLSLPSLHSPGLTR